MPINNLRLAYREGHLCQNYRRFDHAAILGTEAKRSICITSFYGQIT